MMAAALLTGVAMGDDTQSATLLRMHIATVVLLAAGFAVAVVVGDRRALLRSAGRLFTFNRHDAAWVRDRLRRPSDRGAEPAWGMFNAGQKVLAWALSVAVIGLVVTGVQSWAAGGDAGGPHGLAVTATLVLLGAHVFMAVVNPTTRPALAGMVFGRVRHSWAAKHHAGWLDDRTT